MLFLGLGVELFSLEATLLSKLVSSPILRLERLPHENSLLLSVSSPSLMVLCSLPITSLAFFSFIYMSLSDYPLHFLISSLAVLICCLIVFRLVSNIRTCCLPLISLLYSLSLLQLESLTVSSVSTAAVSVIPGISTFFLD